eukprot:jgi/Bigna1/131766/aug1.15_g6474
MRGLLNHHHRPLSRHYCGKRAREDSDESYPKRSRSQTELCNRNSYQNRSQCGMEEKWHHHQKENKSLLLCADTQLNDKVPTSSISVAGASRFSLKPPFYQRRGHPQGHSTTQIPRKLTLYLSSERTPCQFMQEQKRLPSAISRNEQNRLLKDSGRVRSLSLGSLSLYQMKLKKEPVTPTVTRLSYTKSFSWKST